MSRIDFTDDRSSSSEHSEGRQAAEFNNHRNQGNVLFVGNLPFQTPWQNIKDQFRRAGKVRYTDLIADRSGRPKGSALVTMYNAEGARRAIKLFNETEFEGRRLIVRLFDEGPRPQLVQREMMPQYNRRPANAAPVNNHNNNGGNHPHHPQQQQQQHHHMHHDHHAMHHQQMHHGQDLRRPVVGGATNNNNKRGADDVPKPRSQQVSEADRKLFVSNLPFDCSSQALRETFMQIGHVERAEIIVGRSGKSRGMGIVVMTSPNEARIAIQEFDGIEMAGRAMNVRFDNKN